jgi:hypothetical protein
MAAHAPAHIKYGTETIYGPFHRLTKADGQPADLLKALLGSGELWGKGYRGTPIPAVLAYFGALPDGASGVEFCSPVKPDQPYGPVAFWRGPPHGLAQVDGDWAKIKVLVSRVSKDCI